MEVRTVRQMRRNEQLDKAVSKKAGASETPAKAQAVRQQASDRCALSQQALAYWERQNMIRQELHERRASQVSRIRAYLDDMENKEKQLELLRKALDTMKKCMKIAASIMKGNKVPPEDLRYLMKNDPQGYKMALAMRRENPDPKKEKSVLDDEDRNSGGVDLSGIGCKTAAHEAPSAGADTSSIE